jgi:hypothetical protein
LKKLVFVERYIKMNNAYGVLGNPHAIGSQVQGVEQKNDILSLGPCND